MLQMLQAYSAVFSDGTMVKPYFIESIRYPYDENNIIYQAERTVVGNPITPETAKQLQDILYRVIYDEQGTAKYYKIPETEFIGKTGTTQLAVSGSYKSGKTIVSIIAGMPADDPKYMVYYCFEANYNKNAHFHTGPITSYLRKVAMRFNLTQSIQDEFDETTEEVVKKEIITYEMNNLINHSVEYAQNKLLEYDVDIVYLGEGNTVIDQYPKANSTVTTDQKVFLLLDTQGYYMPNMKGWSRKDVVGFWDVSGSGFKIDGFGLVTSQSIPADTYVNRYSEIEVVLE
jgi:penicillin-binding protein 2B